MKSKKVSSQIIWQCLFMAFCYVFLIGFLALCKNQIDSDFAGEMIFSKLISQEKGIFTKNWYYSTEINLLHTPLIMAPFFWIFSSWQTVRVCTGAVIFILLLVSYFYFCRQAGHYKYSILFGTILILPFGWSYLKYILFGYYYANYIMISFFCLGMIYRLNNPDKTKARPVIWVIYLLLSFLAGLGTIRQLIVFFYPLCVAGFLLMMFNIKDEVELGRVPLFDSLKKFFAIARTNSYIKYFFTMCAGAFIASIGYVLNVLVLRNLYSFNSYDRTEFVELDFDRIGEILTGNFYVFGYQKKVEILSIFGISNMLSLFLTVLLVVLTVLLIKNIKKYKITSQISVLYLASAVLCNLFIYVFSNLYAERYMLPYIVFFIIMLNVFMEEYDATEYVKRWICVAVMGIIIFTSIVQYGQWISDEAENDKSDLIGYIDEKGYDFGMASFWNCNIITELTDGRVAMRNVYTAKWSTLENEHWLEIKSYENMTSDKPMFILLSAKEYKKNNTLPHFADEYLVFSNDNYYLFEYENSQQLNSIIATIDTTSDTTTTTSAGKADTEGNNK